MTNIRPVLIFLTGPAGYEFTLPVINDVQIVGADNLEWTLLGGEQPGIFT